MLRTLIVEDFSRVVATGLITRLSTSSKGLEGVDGDSTGVEISADGRFAVFQSFARGLVAGDNDPWCDVFVKNLETNQTTRISAGSPEAPSDAHSYRPRISGNGMFVVFESSSRT
jgi:Tol biopolymer transport system component